MSEHVTSLPCEQEATDLDCDLKNNDNNFAYHSKLLL